MDSQTQELIDSCAAGKVAMLLGTPSTEQLDRFANSSLVRRAKRVALDVVNRPGFWAKEGIGLGWRLVTTTVKFAWLFVKSMFVRDSGSAQ